MDDPLVLIKSQRIWLVKTMLKMMHQLTNDATPNLNDVLILCSSNKCLKRSILAGANIKKDPLIKSVKHCKKLDMHKFKPGKDYFIMKEN